MPTAWDEIRDLIDARHTDTLVSRLLTLDADERELVAGSLREHVALRRDDLADPDWEEIGEVGWTPPAELLRLAGAATLGAVGAVAAWVNRRDLQSWYGFSARPHFGAPGPMVRLFGHRPAAWQADLAVRLAARLRGPADPGAPLALAMLRHTRAEPPAHDPLVLAWISDGALRPADPLFPALLPRIFEAEGAGRLLREAPTDPLIRAADRGVLLDGCVRRFLRGGPLHDLRFFVRLHEALDPAADEVVARRLDYLRLLPAAPGLVAELALRRVRHLDHPDPADVVEAVEGLVFRAEVKLARAGLSWLDETVRASPALADDLAGALVLGFQHASYEVQGRAAQLVLKHRARFGGEAGERIRDGLPALPPSLVARLNPHLLSGPTPLKR
ncbi:DUF6493 family protein [Nonomuraea sp. NPDC047529]|uniref:DUF6493 family protein n=1 Tax=Nonomuraea sp. NPDC047529 TaxID=3155623 RepID=UPI0033F2385F